MHKETWVVLQVLMHKVLTSLTVILAILLERVAIMGILQVRGLDAPRVVYQQAFRKELVQRYSAFLDIFRSKDSVALLFTIS